MSVNDFPVGYPRLAAWVESDPNFTEYRQFKYLRHRCLLHLQDEIVGLERRLGKFDIRDSLENPAVLISRRRDDDRDTPRRAELLNEIKGKLKEYGKVDAGRNMPQLIISRRTTVQDKRYYALGPSYPTQPPQLLQLHQR